MAKALRSLQKWRLNRNQHLSLILHVAFFLIRRSIHFTILFLALSSDEIDPQVRMNADLFCSFSMISVLSLFLVLRSVVSGNVFGYYFSIGVMFHNSFIAISIPSTGNFVSYEHFWILFSLISLSYFIEGLLSLYLVYLRKNEYNIKLFKTIGADKLINNAFATRKCLEASKETHIFLTLLVFRKLWWHSIENEKSVAYCISILLVLTFLQQCATSINFNDENTFQRQVTIAISFLKIIVALIIILIRLIMHFLEYHVVIDCFTTLLCTDILFVSLIIHYFLIKDFNQFGSGLRNFFKLKNTRIEL